MAGLEGVRVLELGEGVSAAYAAKLLGDLGADVVKVEPPTGDRTRERGPFPGDTPDRERSGLYLYLNANKRGTVLDLDTPEGREPLSRWLAASDIVFHNLSPERARSLGLDAAGRERLRGDTVLCSITPFGATGPLRDYRAEELTVACAGGWAWLSPGASTRPDLPPLKAAGHQSDLQAGLAGATAALAALYRARTRGVGEYIDVSGQATIAAMLEQAVPAYTYSGLVATRLGQRGLNPWGIFRCQDGLIFLCTIEQDQWERLVEFMGRPEWTELDVFADFGGRLENVDLLQTFLAEWIGAWRVEELFHEGQKRRICFAPVFSMSELEMQDHLAARDFLVDVAHPHAGSVRQLGPPVRLSEPWWSVRRGAPTLGEHTEEVRRELAAPPPARAEPASVDPARPLEGVRVADLSWVWAGPFCAMQLAHLGAHVIKLESESRPDLGRRLPIFVPGEEPGLNRSGYFNQWNQGKSSVRLNLSHPEALKVARRVIAECDVLVENYATGVMERLGLDREHLFEINPRLIVASISGFGGEGPLAEYMAYGPAIAPLSGLSSMTGYAGEGPSEVGISLGDPTAGSQAAAAICAALVARERTGRGQYIDVSLWEATAVLSGEGFMDWSLNGREPTRRGNRDPQMCPHGVFRAAGDDAWVSIVCANDEEWSALAAHVAPELAADARFRTAAGRKANEDEVEARLEQWTRARDRFEITAELQALGVATFPALSPEDLVRDPQLLARGFLEELDHPEVGRRTHTGIPWRLAHGPNGLRAPAPCLGADTAAVLVELCGYTPEEIARLEREGVLH